MNSNSSPLSPMVNAVGVKPPRFTPKTPALWFVQMEAQFALANIKSEVTKFYHIVANLPTDVLTASCDITLKTPEAGDYARLRKEILDIYTPSSSVRLTALLEGEFTHGTRPSLFFRSLKAQVTDLNLTDEFLLTSWISKLPESIRPALLVMKQQGSSLQTILAAADDAINSLSSSPQIAVLKTNTKPKQYRQTFRKMRPLQKQTRGQRSNTIKSVAQMSKEISWFHRRFGLRAKHCKKPCQYKKGNEQQ